MTPLKESHVDLEAGGGGDTSAGCGDNHKETSSLQVSDADEQSSREEKRASTISEEQVVEKRRVSSVSECSVEVDLETGVEESKLHLSKSEKDCRICHLSFDATNPESGIPIELGCSCKDDLAAAHQQCAEAWFKIKGDIICEICGSIALNVVDVNTVTVVEQWNEGPTVAVAVVPAQSESRNFWHGHRFLNFLLACMVFAFVISWLFHFNVPS